MIIDVWHALNCIAAIAPSPEHFSMARMRYFPPHPKAQRRSRSRSPVFRPESSSFPSQPSFSTPPAFFDKEAVAAAQLTQLHLATEHVEVKVQPDAVKLPSFAQLEGNLPAVNSSKLPISSCRSTCKSFLSFPAWQGPSLRPAKPDRVRLRSSWCTVSFGFNDRQSPLLSSKARSRSVDSFSLTRARSASPSISAGAARCRYFCHIQP